MRLSRLLTVAKDLAWKSPIRGRAGTVCCERHHWPQAADRTRPLCQLLARLGLPGLSLGCPFGADNVRDLTPWHGPLGANSVHDRAVRSSVLG